MTNQALLNHQIVSTEGTSPCNLYPVMATDEPTTPMAKGRAERLHRQAGVSTPTEAWLLNQPMKAENIYRQQQLHDRDIQRLEQQVRLLKADMVWLKVVAVVLIFACGGLVSCLV